MKSIKLMLAGTALALVAASPAVANAEKHDTSAMEHIDRDQMPAMVKDMVFTDDEKRIIQDYYSHKGDDENDAPKSSKGKGKNKDKSKDMPPGLAKRDELPPGLQMQLEKNGTLPPGLEKRRLPDDLDRRLPRRLEGISRYEVGQDVILLDDKTSKILDVMRGVNAAMNL